MGDPAGVGPELILRAARSLELRSQCDLHIFADWKVLQECCRHLGWSIPEVSVVSVEAYQECDNLQLYDTVLVIDHAEIDFAQFEIGKVSQQCGHLAFRLIQSSIDAAISGKISAVATGPINKLALKAAGYNYPGHTEMFAERAATDDRWCMMQYSPTITCTFATVHCGYAQVPKLLSAERILDTILLTDAALNRILRKKPKLLVCGLNPHAGESGLFGDGEEERFISPAIEAARKKAFGWKVLCRQTRFLFLTVYRIAMPLCACITIRVTFPLRPWHSSLPLIQRLDYLWFGLQSIMAPLLTSPGKEKPNRIVYLLLYAWLHLWLIVSLLSR